MKKIFNLKIKEQKMRKSKNEEIVNVLRCANVYQNLSKIRRNISKILIAANEALKKYKDPLTEYNSMSDEAKGVWEELHRVFDKQITVAENISPEFQTTPIVGETVIWTAQYEELSIAQECEKIGVKLSDLQAGLTVLLSKVGEASEKWGDPKTKYDSMPKEAQEVFKNLDKNLGYIFSKITDTGKEYRLLQVKFYGKYSTKFREGVEEKLKNNRCKGRWHH